MVDNPKDKDSKVEGKDNPKTWTPPVGQEWLLEKFSKAEKPTEEQAKAYSEGEKKLRGVEAERNKIKTELDEVRSGGVTNFNEAMLADKEDELAKLKAENEALKKPKSTLSVDQEAYVKDWHSRLISEDPVVAARAFQEGIAGEIYRYDQRKKVEEQSRSFQRQMEKATDTHTKEELDTLAPYVYQLRQQRPDLEKSPYAVEDLLDKAKIRMAEEKNAIEKEEQDKIEQKTEAQTTQPSGTTEEPVDWDKVMKMGTKEREEFLRSQGVNLIDL